MSSMQENLSINKRCNEHLYCSLADKHRIFTSPDFSPAALGTHFPIFRIIKIDEFKIIYVCYFHRNQKSM